ncbi:hypothetical protein Tco_1070523 [Tanacetum coccineum]|uniref:Uncharacterized protein n=1 Tax=Tanacetum coccineum TaxID=301880 RepID=A0ABQ5HLM5_9ASTR
MGSGSGTKGVSGECEIGKGGIGGGGIGEGGSGEGGSYNGDDMGTSSGYWAILCDLPFELYFGRPVLVVYRFC